MNPEDLVNISCKPTNPGPLELAYPSLHNPFAAIVCELRHTVSGGSVKKKAK